MDIVDVAGSIIIASNAVALAAVLARAGKRAALIAAIVVTRARC